MYASNTYIFHMDDRVLRKYSYSAKNICFDSLCDVLGWGHTSNPPLHNIGVLKGAPRRDQFVEITFKHSVNICTYVTAMKHCLLFFFTFFSLHELCTTNDRNAIFGNNYSTVAVVKLSVKFVKNHTVCMYICMYLYECRETK